MATNNTPYTLDHINKRIILTKEFAAKSSIYGTVAYDTLVGLRKDYSDYKFEMRVIKSSAKIKRAHPSYQKMQDYIQRYVSENNRNSALEEFQQIIAKAQKSRNAYKSVLDWFNTNYPSYFGANWNEGNEGGESDD